MSAKFQLFNILAPEAPEYDYLLYINQDSKFTYNKVMSSALNVVFSPDKYLDMDHLNIDALKEITPYPDAVVQTLQYILIIYANIYQDLMFKQFLVHVFSILQCIHTLHIYACSMSGKYNSKSSSSTDLQKAPLQYILNDIDPGDKVQQLYGYLPPTDVPILFVRGASCPIMCCANGVLKCFRVLENANDKVPRRNTTIIAFNHQGVRSNY
jgi:hypothetical protein